MRGPILVIEASTQNGSVAVIRDDALLAATTFMSRDPASGARTEALGSSVATCLRSAGISARDVTGVVCGAGPGGFTSLRCAAALAKGLCTALDLPLFAVSSLELLAWTAPLADGTYVAATTAGRGEWFALSFGSEDGVVSVATPELVDDAELRDRSARDGVKLVGPLLDVDVHPSAAAAVGHMEPILRLGRASLEAWEPDYGRLAEAQVKWEAVHGRPLRV